VLGQAGKKGGYLDSVHSAIPGWNEAINDDVTESTAYLVGHVACAIAFPEYALARDFTADVLRGDPVAAALDSLGYLGAVKNLLKSSPVILSFFEKVPNKFDASNKFIRGIEKLGIDLEPAGRRAVVTEALEYNIGEFNRNQWVLRQYDRTKKMTVLGTEKSYDGSTTFSKIGKDLDINFLYMNPQSPKNIQTYTNRQLLDTMIANDDIIPLSVHPDVVRNALGAKAARSTFLQEVDYLMYMGYRVSETTTTFTRNGNIYELYTMVKVT